MTMMIHHTIDTKRISTKYYWLFVVLSLRQQLLFCNKNRHQSADAFQLVVNQYSHIQQIQQQHQHQQEQLSLVQTFHGGKKTRYYYTCSTTQLKNEYDDWRSGSSTVLVDTNTTTTTNFLPLNDENIIKCINQFIDSDYGQQMFGRHTVASEIGITGDIEFVQYTNEELTIQLVGQFWHRRETIMKRLTRWLLTQFSSDNDNNCRRINVVKVLYPEQMFDFNEIIDYTTGKVVSQIDNRTPDYTGQRQLMELNNIDPDIYGPFYTYQSQS